MLFPIGIIVVLGSVIGGYVMHHGKLPVLWQPNEFIIIIGASIGAFLISNPSYVIKNVMKSLKTLVKGAPYNKATYMELLQLLFMLFKTARIKGLLELESHIENPHESQIFSRFPKVSHDHHAMEFLCDYLRLLTMGIDNQYMMEDQINAELDIHHKEGHLISHAVTMMGEGMPALGIVAAVLGVITTMGSITEPPEVLGGLIGAALVGTFTGVLVSYGFIGPMGSFIEKYGDQGSKFLECMKVGIITHMQGNAPQVTVEFVRKNIPSDFRPTFQEVEVALSSEPPAAS